MLNVVSNRALGQQIGIVDVDDTWQDEHHSVPKQSAHHVPFCELYGFMTSCSEQ